MNVIDKMQEERTSYDPNSVLAGGVDGVDHLDEMPDYGVNHHGIPE